MLLLNLPACRRQGQQRNWIASREMPGLVSCADAVPAADLAGLEQKQNGRQGGADLAVAAMHGLRAAMNLAIPATLWMGL